MEKTLTEITNNIYMVLFNNVTEVEDYLEPIIEREIEEEEDYIEYHQYYAINKSDGEYLAEKAPEYFSLLYSEKCDLFILWVQLLDNWGNYSITL